MPTFMPPCQDIIRNTRAFARFYFIVQRWLKEVNKLEINLSNHLLRLSI